MSVTIAWPDSKAMPGMCIELQDTKYWIRPIEDDEAERLDPCYTVDLSSHTLVMDDDELSNLLFAYAKRKGIIK